MSEPNTKPSVMSRDDVRKIIEQMTRDAHAALEHGGARIDLGVRDQRFTKLINWVWASLGAGALAVSYWGVSTIQELNVKVGILITQRAADTEAITDLRARIRDLEQRR